jgi:hypothetical protein
MGSKTTTNLSFSSKALFAVRDSFVAVHERPNVVHLYHYAEDVREELLEFFQAYVEKVPLEEKGGREEDDEDPDAATILIYIKQTRPYQVGDIVMDVYDNVIYTAGTAVGAHASRVVVTSNRINVYTSVKAYVDG